MIKLCEMRSKVELSKVIFRGVEVKGLKTYIPVESGKAHQVCKYVLGRVKQLKKRIQP